MNLILLVGPPGSGKSTLSKTYPDYTYINQDAQGKQHLEFFNRAILAGEKIIVDRMNFNKIQRARYLAPTKAAGYTTKIIVLHESRATCLERCLKRVDHPTIKDSVAANAALNTFFSKYERPTPDEADVVEFRYPEGFKPYVITVDLDGTLCQIDHRLHHVRGDKKDWAAFFAGIEDDLVNAWCGVLVNELSKKYNILFASGRPSDYQEATQNWLDKTGFKGYPLFMRCSRDYRSDDIAKEIILDFEILTRYTPLFFVDDRKQVCDMWRRRGFVCLQCAPGEF